MTFAITDWNVDENRDWYVRLTELDENILVGLYQSQAEATAGNNRHSYGYADFGTDSECTLTAETGNTIELFQEDYAWHLRVTGQVGDDTLVFKVGQFTDLPSIEHSIFRNLDLIQRKATYEIDLHTHFKTVRGVPLGIHIPDIAVGNKLTINSTRRNVNEVNQIVGHTIAGIVSANGETRLTSSLEIVKFTTMVRG